MILHYYILEISKQGDIRRPELHLKKRGKWKTNQEY